MHDARRGKVHIKAIPHIAHNGAKHPFAGNLHRGIEGHGAESHQHIGHSQ